jgi:hypothetical protein
LFADPGVDRKANQIADQFSETASCLQRVMIAASR